MALSVDSIPAYCMEEVADAPRGAVDPLPSGSGLDHRAPFMGTVTAVRELHKGGGRSCAHVEVDIAGSRIEYAAGAAGAERRVGGGVQEPPRPACQPGAGRGGMIARLICARMPPPPPPPLHSR